MLAGWLGPIVVIVAVLLGGCALRLVDRYEARLPALSRRRRARGGSSPRSRVHAPAPELWARLVTGPGPMRGSYTDEGRLQ